MKKLLPSAVLALVVSAGMTAQSFAGCCFGLFTKSCGCCGCGAKFCVRQYNAFSPVCSGTVFCDGCCPFGACGGYGGNGGYGPGCAGGMCAGGACGVMPFSGMPAPCCGGGGCGDGASLGSLPASEPMSGVPMGSASADANGVPMGGVPMGGMPMGGMPMGSASIDANPIVSPAPLPSGPTSQLINDKPIQNATYRPASYSPTVVPVAPAPAPMQPQTMVAPSYWGN